MARNRWLFMVAPLVAGLAFVGACGDDDDAEDTAALGDAYDEFTADLASVTDVGVLMDDESDRLRDNCDALNDGTDIDDFGDFCDDLDDSLDDGDQVAFDGVKQQWAQFDPLVRAEIGEDIADVAAEDDDDGPLEGGDDGDDDDDLDDDADDLLDDDDDDGR